VERFGLEKRVIFSSFNHVRLHHLHQYRPKISIAVLYLESLFKPWIYAKTIGASALHPYYLTLTEEVIEGCHQVGMMVRPFTVDEEKDLKRMIDMEVDAVITNVPTRLQAMLNNSQSV
jgi:glycerophosphoryl diester phosphodiesterase